MRDIPVELNFLLQTMDSEKILNISYFSVIERWMKIRKMELFDFELKGKKSISDQYSINIPSAPRDLKHEDYNFIIIFILFSRTLSFYIIFIFVK